MCILENEHVLKERLNFAELTFFFFYKLKNQRICALKKKKTYKLKETLYIEGKIITYSTIEENILEIIEEWVNYGY